MVAPVHNLDPTILLDCNLGGGARSATFEGGNELKKTGARSARARTRGLNPVVER
jgi:hypothetical protein